MPVIAFFEGDLVADPDLSVSPEGSPRCEVVVRPMPRSERQRAQWERASEPPTYHVTALDDDAYALASLTEGTRVVIIGRVKAVSWVDGEGTRHRRDTVVVDSLGQSIHAGALVA
ncbi:single-strand DNA-binding protein [Nocardioides sp. YR527]|uniref:single-stranded DNA-binding protein n=1 Tax=Nocardioides sp. YR527 TaxID=1881028 RepID=UPI00087E2CFD|nr:single-stranded DNA-binding protein [Nocardioides sp. YR527]SDL34316.1 single-strand DNA-binding protein [Nocardioides sp. YR527]